MKLKRAVVLLSKALKKVNRNRHIIDTETKAFKSKEKEIYNLEKKVNNQQDTSQWMKGDIVKVKSENQRLKSILNIWKRKLIKLL